MSDPALAAITTLRLNERQRRFVESFISHGIAARAAEEAGYAQPYNVKGAQLLATRNVTAALAAYRAARAASAVMTRDEREKLLSEMARGTGEFKGADLRVRVRALELLARMNGDFATVLIPGNAPGSPAALPPAIEGESTEEVDVVRIYLPDNGRR